MATDDTLIQQLIINQLSEDELKVLKDNNSVPPNELFLTPESSKINGVDTIPLPVGTIICSSIVQDNSGLHLLNGDSLAQNGIYSEFCSWLKSRIVAMPNSVPTCSIEEYATDMDTYQQCGKFVINNISSTLTSGSYSVEANSIKLPTITEFVASANGGKELGSAELDEFKSHSHILNGLNGRVAEGNYADLYYEPNGATLRTANEGGSETRPKNIRYYYYIVVGTVTKTDIEVNIDNVVADINLINSKLAKTEQVEIIYDRKSGDSNINWGYTSGIGDGISITDKDFSKYKKLICYVFNTTMSTIIVDFSIDRDGVYDASNVWFGGFSSSLYIEIGRVTIYNVKAAINFQTTRQWQNEFASHDATLVKIEGVY